MENSANRAVPAILKKYPINKPGSSREVKDYIICAAVRTADGIVHVGKRHCDCFVIIGALGGITYHHKSEQGFVNSKWEFLKRSEAFKVAEKAGQLLEKDRHGRGVLYSEDIY